MAFEEGTATVMPVAPTGYGFNNGFGGNNDSWLFILFLFAMMGGWGGNGYGNNGGNFYTDNLVTSGFNQAATAGTLAGIQSSITNGFGAAEVASCNRAMDALTASYTNQIASMNQSFANTQALDARLNDLAMGLQSCCCDNRASIADLKYTVATEACADRNAVTSALRDVLTASTANTQRILDVLCQQDISAKQDRINDLERQLSLANLSASQTAQTAAIISALKPATTTA